MRVAVVVLQPLTGEGGPAGSGPHYETAAARIGQSPELVASSLKAEHRVEDVERDERQPMGGIGGGRGLQ